MSGRLGGFLRNSTIYLFGGVLTKLLSFLLLPLYTALLSPEDFGLYNVGTSVLSVLVPFFGLEIWTGVLRFLLEAKDGQGRARVVRAGFTVLLGASLLLTALFIAAGKLFSIPYLWELYVLALTQGVHYVYLSAARGYGHNGTYAVTGLVSSAVTLTGNVVMIAFLHLGVRSLYLSQILGLWAQILCIEGRTRLFTRSVWKARLDRPFLRELIRFSLPLSFNTICYFFAGNYNSVVISARLGLEVNGYYSVAGRFVTVLSLLTSCFTMSLQELIYRSSGERDRAGFYSTGINYYFKFITLAILMMLPVIRAVFPYFVGGAFSDSLPLIPLYFLAAIASNFASFLGNYFLSERLMKPLSLSLALAGGINLAVIHLLIGPLGAQSANWALFLGFTASAVYRLRRLGRHLPVRLSLRYAAAFAALFGATLGLYFRAGAALNLLWAAAMGGVFLYAFRHPARSILLAVRARLKK